MSEIKALLINPPYANYFTSEHFKPSRPNEALVGKNLPLGLAYLASFLRIKGVSVQCIDLEIEQLSLSELSKLIKDGGIKYVGISSVSAIIEKSITIAQYLKCSTEATIILGGIHATAEPLETASLSCFDVVVYGEGEETLWEIVSGIPLEKIAGVVYKKDGKIYKTGSRSLVSNINSLPFPAKDLFFYEKYRPSPHRDLDLSVDQAYCTVISSRGCPYKCKFCYSKGVFLNRVRYRSIENILKEIEETCHNKERTKLMFYDDTFSHDKKRTYQQ